MVIVFLCCLNCCFVCCETGDRRCLRPPRHTISSWSEQTNSHTAARTTTHIRRNINRASTTRFVCPLFARSKSGLLTHSCFCLCVLSLLLFCFRCFCLAGCAAEHRNCQLSVLGREVPASADGPTAARPTACRAPKACCCAGALEFGFDLVFCSSIHAHACARVCLFVCLCACRISAWTSTARLSPRAARRLLTVRTFCMTEADELKQTYVRTHTYIHTCKHINSFTMHALTLFSLFLLLTHSILSFNRVYGDGVMLLAVDILPAELPRDATDAFGDMLLPLVMPVAKGA